MACMLHVSAACMILQDAGVHILVIYSLSYYYNISDTMQKEVFQ